MGMIKLNQGNIFKDIKPFPCCMKDYQALYMCLCVCVWDSLCVDVL